MPRTAHLMRLVATFASALLVFLAVPASTASAATSSCYVKTFIYQVYLPADIGNSLPYWVKRHLKTTVDYDTNRGWKMAQVNLRQVVTSDGTRITKTEATEAPYLSKTAGLIGARVSTSGLKTYLEGKNARAQVNGNFTFSTPFGAWNPNYNFTMSMLTIPNGMSYYSPSGVRPSEGIYTSALFTRC